jgi:aminoglycoside 3-N-acetyltransferase I
MSDIRVVRLAVADGALARTLFTTMAGVFETEAEPLSDAYLTQLLERGDFWALMATIDGELAGGLTAHTLRLTRAEVSEVFVYDLAVVPRRQRQGVGRALVAALRTEAARAGITVAFVPADNDDTHALDFYRAIGGVPAPVTIFTFGEEAT